jgi:hypothetical protein
VVVLVSVTSVVLVRIFVNVEAGLVVVTKDLTVDVKVTPFEINELKVDSLEATVK